MLASTYHDPNQFIVARRKELGLSRADVCAESGNPPLSENMLTLIENGGSAVPLARCQEFAAALRVDPVWFTLCILKKRYPGAADVLSRAIWGNSDAHQKGVRRGNQ